MAPSSTIRRLLQSVRFRFLKKFHRPGRRAWWTVTRTSVSRGVAIGLFFGVLIPVAQSVFAVSTAVALRANLWVTALSTLITNPFTLPFVYVGAYRIGNLIAGPSRDLADDVAASQAAVEQSLDVVRWHTALLDWASTIALPFVIGLLLLATVTALVGYLVVELAWAVCSAWRRRRGGLGP